MKKLLSFILTLVMFFTLFVNGFSGVAYATSAASCTVRVEGLSGTITEGSAYGSTYLDIFKKVMKNNKIPYHIATSSFGEYIDSINNLNSGTLDKNNGWQFYVKSADPSKGISSPYPYIPSPGDEIVFYYGSFITPYLTNITFNPNSIQGNQGFTMTFTWNNQGTSTPITNAVVAIDNLNYITNNNGNISIQGLVEGPHCYKISGYSSTSSLPSVVNDKGTFTVDATTKSSFNYSNSSYNNLVKNNSLIAKNIDAEVNLTSSKLSTLSDPWLAIDMEKLGLKSDTTFISTIAKDVKNGVKSINNTTLEKYIMSLISVGYSPYNFLGKNLVAELYNRDINTYQINDAVFALGLYRYGKISENYKIKKADLINLILAKKISYNANGKNYSGWTYGGNEIDGDMTGITICALSPLYLSNAAVKTDIDKAIQSISYLENEGGYITSSYGISSETLSFVLLGLVSIGINPEGIEFTKNKGDLVSAQLSFKGSNGEYKHSLEGGNNLLSTEEALRALTALQRYKKYGSYDYFQSDISTSKLISYSEPNGDIPLALEVTIIVMGIALFFIYQRKINKK